MTSETLRETAGLAGGGGRADHQDLPVFIVGLGLAGATLWQIAGGMCLRHDATSWTLRGGELIALLPQVLVDRLAEAGFVAVAPDKLMDKDRLVLTDAGRAEAVRYAWARAQEIAGQLEPPRMLGPTGAELHYTARGAAYDLVRRVCEEARSFDQQMADDPGFLIASAADGAPDIADWLSQGDDEQRRRRLFHLLESVAEAAMVKLTPPEMQDLAAFGAAIAAEAFARAPDKDWAWGEGEAGGEGG